MSKEQSGALSPQEVILQAFVFFKATEMDEASLVRVSLAANCPREALAKQVLAKMVEANFLSVRTAENGVKMYSKIEAPPSMRSPHLN